VGFEEEALLMAGDQDAAKDGSPGLGVALLFSTQAKSDRVVRLVSISRSPAIVDVVPHAANGLAALLSSIARHRDGLCHTSCRRTHRRLFNVTVTLEIS
jgi:hypothetical protein